MPSEALNPDVRQDTIQQTICRPGYTASVRPSTPFANGVELKLLRERGLPASASKDYELDRVIPLGLAGHPRSLTDLALQEWESENGVRKKDQLERRMQRGCAACYVLVERANERAAGFYTLSAHSILLTYGPAFMCGTWLSMRRSSRHNVSTSRGVNGSSSRACRRRADSRSLR